VLLKHYSNNCVPTAICRLFPTLREADILKACFNSGYTEEFGMLPHQIHQALDMLNISFTVEDLVRFKPGHCVRDRRKSMTLQQALIATSTQKCLIRITGHMVASNKGLLIDPNFETRRTRRRVLEVMTIHNATIPDRTVGSISDDSLILFKTDPCLETRKGSNRDNIYARVYLASKPQGVYFKDARRLGYRRSMLQRHLDQGLAIIA